MIAQVSIGPLTLSLPWLVPILGVSVAIPVVLHLLSSVRAPEVPFPTLRFLRVSMEKTARRRRVQHWFLLLMRTLLIALLLLAITQPLHKPKGEGIGFAGPHAAAVIIDNSLSMAAAEGARRRFDAARSIAKDILRSADKPEELVLLFTNGQASQVEPAVRHDLSEALRQIDAAQPGLGRAALRSTVESAAELLATSGLPNKVVYILSDMQGESFEALADAKLTDEDDDVPLLVVDCGRQGSGNLAVTEVEVRGAGQVVGAKVVIGARVINSSPEPRRAKVVLEVDGARQEHLTQNLLLTRRGTANSEQEVQFAFTFKRPGVHHGRVLIDAAADILPEDDAREFVLTVSDRIRALVIAGPGGSNDPTGPGYYALAALKVPSSISPIVTGLAEVTPERVGDNDVVVCCDVPRFDATLAEALRRFVVDGGTLIVFVGPNTDTDNLNRTLGESDPPLLPAVLGEPVGDPVRRRDASKLVRVDEEHPIFAGLYDAQAPYQTVLVYSYLAVAMRSSRPARTLAWLERDRPLLIEHTAGRGRGYLVTTSANTVWTNLPTRPVFLPMLVRMCLGSVAETGTTAYHEGAQVRLAVRGDQPTDIDVVLPGDASGRSATIRVRTRPGPEGNVGVFTETFVRGMYAWRAVDDGKQSGQFVVTGDGRESDLAPMGADDLVMSLPDQQVYVAGNLDELREAVRQAARGNPVWDYFLLFVLILATVEALFANRYRPAEAQTGGRLQSHAA